MGKPRVHGSRGPTRKRPKHGRAAVLAEFREFKSMFHKWVDRIKLDWCGSEPFSHGVEYRFILPNEMVSFVVSLVEKSHTAHDRRSVMPEVTPDETIEHTRELQRAIDQGMREHLRDTDEVLDRRTFPGGSDENI